MKKGLIVVSYLFVLASCNPNTQNLCSFTVYNNHSDSINISIFSNSDSLILNINNIQPNKTVYSTITNKEPFSSYSLFKLLIMNAHGDTLDTYFNSFDIFANDTICYPIKGKTAKINDVNSIDMYRMTQTMINRKEYQKVMEVVDFLLVNNIYRYTISDEELFLNTNQSEYKKITDEVVSGYLQMAKFSAEKMNLSHKVEEYSKN